MDHERVDTAERPGGTPRRRMFKQKLPRLSPEALERQSNVTLLAWQKLGRDTAIGFLNAHSDVLGGRPLDLTVASARGHEAVQRLIGRLADARSNAASEAS